ncbi:MAG: RluA family pseudouridine synthase [Acidobacteria bacterium ACB1]|nr:RluA family pseudouridine synthase [Acidobacteria bacterium ACB1]RIJ90627.1 MAG: RNA pseudouridine synthase [Acidobacteriota bacterium]
MSIALSFKTLQKCRKIADFASSTSSMQTIQVETRQIIVVPEAARKMRLEDFLLAHFSHLSKMYLRDLVNRELCEVNGRWENIGRRLLPNDLVEIVIDTTRETAMLPEKMPLDIIFEDEHLIALNKPVGMLVHPSHRENRGTLLNGLADYLNPHKPTLTTPAIRPGLPHRLDKDTSGILVVAKTKLAHRNLTRAFMRKQADKRYLAVVSGHPTAESGEIDAPIGRDAEAKLWKVMPDGKPALSRYKVLKRFDSCSLVELEPVTGRTNQLRVHLEHIGHPVIGDVVRGGGERDRLYLHAHKLSVPHPAEHGRRVEVEAPMPTEFSFLIDRHRATSP